MESHASGRSSYPSQTGSTFRHIDYQAFEAFLLSKHILLEENALRYWGPDAQKSIGQIARIWSNLGETFSGLEPFFQAIPFSCPREFRIWYQAASAIAYRYLFGETQELRLELYRILNNRDPHTDGALDQLYEVYSYDRNFVHTGLWLGFLTLLLAQDAFNLGVEKGETNEVLTQFRQTGNDFLAKLPPTLDVNFLRRKDGYLRNQLDVITFKPLSNFISAYIKYCYPSLRKRLPSFVKTPSNQFFSHFPRYSDSTQTTGDPDPDQDLDRMERQPLLFEHVPVQEPACYIPQLPQKPMSEGKKIALSFCAGGFVGILLMICIAAGEEVFDWGLEDGACQLGNMVAQLLSGKNLKRDQAMVVGAVLGTTIVIVISGLAFVLAYASHVFIHNKEHNDWFKPRFPETSTGTRHSSITRIMDRLESGLKNIWCGFGGTIWPTRKHETGIAYYEPSHRADRNNSAPTVTYHVPQQEITRIVQSQLRDKETSRTGHPSHLPRR